VVNVCRNAVCNSYTLSTYIYLPANSDIYLVVILYTTRNIFQTVIFLVYVYSPYRYSPIPKLDKLSLLATVYDPDIICIVQTWLEGTIDDIEISIPSYHSNRLDRNKHGGGVLLYMKNVYQYTILPKSNSALELLSVVVQHNAISTRI
jgi:hypothetical protein